VGASKLTGVIGVLLWALALGCAGPQAPAASGEGPRAAAAPTGPKRIVGVLNGDPAGLSEVVNRAIAQFSIPGTAEMQRMVLDGMAVENDQGILVARLAEAVPSAENGLWRVTPDGRMETTWKIRPGARWHDGTPFTSDDLAFTLQEANTFWNAHEWDVS
jgi:ABC-type transport system substrate-binding protein